MDAPGRLGCGSASGVSEMRWPLPLAPHEDELLSSFLVRAAHRHGLSPYRFCAFHFPGMPVWNRDIDRSASNKLLAAIAAKAGLSPEQVVQMTLRSAEAKLGGGAANGPAPWINTVGIYHRLRRRWGLQYCPDCLEESPVFYQSWRISFLLVCNRHRRILQDACPHCDAPLAIHRQMISVRLCHQCSRPLSWTSQELGLSVEKLIRAQSYFENALRDGTGTIGGRPICGEDLFQGARVLASLLRPTRLSARDDAGHRRPSLEQARVHARAGILLHLENILDTWPLAFMQVAEEQHRTQRSFMHKSLPAWLASMVDELPVGLSRKAAAPKKRHSLRAKLDHNRRRNADWRAIRATLLWQAASK